MSLFSGVKSFILEKFWRPVVDETVFYNPFNTAVYSVFFAVAAAYIGYPTIKKLGVDLDRNFFTGIAPFVFLGGAVRSLKDINVFSSIVLETPFIYFLMFGLTAGSVIVSKKIESWKNIPYHRTLFGTGISMLALSLSFYSVNNFTGLVMALAALLTVTVIFYGLLKFLKPELLAAGFYIPIVSHYFDATVTGIALMFPGTAEKHVLARLFIDIFGSLNGMLIMKTLVIVPSVYYINKNTGGDKKKYYLFLISVLGIAIGTRNLLSFVTLT